MSRGKAKKFDTREGWLKAALAEFGPWFKEAGKPLPKKLLVSVSWPKGGGRAAGGAAIGQCFGKTWAGDGETVNVTISPVLSEPVRVLDVLLHEGCHAAVGVEHAHRKPFTDLALKHFGLTGKPTATVCEKGSALYDRLAAVAKRLGPYPHVAMADHNPLKAKRPPGGGWVKFESKSDDTYILRISAKALREWGAPLDPDGDEMVPA